ncbi:pyridoxal phosphate-dependent aminotransferase [Hymenobacter profundi]|uniref:Aminotransferase class I/II-fold pyridoxal phosphate-dependent enzyme n=1 Tax=Hymenobacter profundi TaxID=1982110 RepID=A0ABS6WYR9_9BACT|nr:aminotransferase class I/II-fold pyridoxal phosphate-dependent enzyme [Hymenobacter profundi]MBW3128754.1 aminotransferase class I/II-fold pyridoxal phosphate-dependent enzyme [Hymenobacter profundi]
MSSSPLVSLASGYGPYPTPAVAVEAAMAALRSNRALPVSAAEGQPELRAALASHYRQRGATHVTPEHVVVTPGGKAGLLTLLQAVLQPGDEVLVPTPAWFGFWEVIQRAGGVVRLLPLSADDNYAFTPTQLAEALTPRTRLLLLTNPNNPTGRLYTRAEVGALLEVTQQHPELLVLSDEIYDLVQFGEDPTPTLLSFPDPHAQHLVLNGFSKSLELVGWGVGYLVMPPALARKCAAIQFATGKSVPAPAQAAAQAAVEAADAIAVDLLARLAPNRTQLLHALTALPHVPALPPPAGTYYAFPDLRAYLPPAESEEVASAALVAHLKSNGVEVVDGTSCGTPGFVRLSYAVESEVLTEALPRLRMALEAMRK